MKTEDEDEIPCEVCGAPTMMTSTKKCDGCYEVTLRLPRFLDHANGRAFVRRLLAEHVNKEVEDEKRVHDLCERGIQICSEENGCVFFGSKKRKEVLS
jgi:hypothetical protein